MFTKTELFRHRVGIQVLFLGLATVAGAHAAEYYVSPSGADSYPGTFSKPLQTLRAAADVLQPGDVCIVRAGTYREYVNPRHGGAAEDKRIVYRAYPGERPILTGAERLASWTSLGGGVWKAELPNSFFGQFNPYAAVITGSWLDAGVWQHLGQVYLNGEGFTEQRTPEAVGRRGQSWCCQVSAERTTIWANFGQANPNHDLAEINVREFVLWPTQPGLNFITVDGFTLTQAASQWSAPDRFQTGLIGPNYGNRWIIQNCDISDSRCAGISIGYVPGRDYSQISNIGHHVIRHNHIRRCGQTGISGALCCAATLIEGNLIEDIQCLGEFNGHEVAPIKLHYAIDTVIKNNIVHGSGRDGIWLDTRAQGARITGNVLYDIAEWSIFLEANHGPILVDNNIVYGGVNYEDSEAVTYAHNLFIDSVMDHQPSDRRQLAYYEPHSSTAAGKRRIILRDNRYYNNIFLVHGLNMLPDAPGYKANYNIFWQPSFKSRWDDKSTDDNTPGNIDYMAHGRLRELPGGVEISLNVSDATFKLNCPLITRDFIGVDSLTRQGIENHDGSPITIDRDLFGNLRNAVHPLVGPFENLKPGKNTFIITAGLPSAAKTASASQYSIPCHCGKAKPAAKEGESHGLKMSTADAGDLRDTKVVFAPSGPCTVSLGGGVTMELVPIPVGSFPMGSPDDGGSERPVHKVNITKPFYLGKYKVTQEQWNAVMGHNPSHFRGPQNPVDTVSWEDGQAFAAKLNQKLAVSNVKFSLPTEAQWEYACRAGSTAKFGFGDAEKDLAEYAWFDRNAGGTTHPVGQKKPNAWGLYDMHGNVWEWCADALDWGYYGHSPADDPFNAASGIGRILRGGCWDTMAVDCRAAFRDIDGPASRNLCNGLRISCVRQATADKP